MREIGLTQRQVAIVDDEDFEWLNCFKWYAAKTEDGNFYASRGTACSDGQKTTYMHRIILRAPAGTIVDHINGNSLDNRRDNLRLATHQQNLCNRKYPHKNNKLGVKGVHWHKSKKKYQASIKHNRKKIHLGYFKLLEEASRAYCEAETKYFGVFARQANQPPSDGTDRDYLHFTQEVSEELKKRNGHLKRENSKQITSQDYQNMN